MEVALDDVESPPKRRKVGDGTPQTSAPSPPELVTVEDSSSDEAPEEKEEGRGEGGNVMQQDAKDARAGGEGERREKDGEWCKQSPVTDWRSYDGERGDEKEGGVSTGAKSMFGTIPEFGADAVMIGSHVVASPCHMKINMGSWVTVALKIEDEDAKDTTLDIPEGDITFFGVRYEKENHLRQEQKLSRCKDKSKDKDEGDGVEAEDGKRDIGIKPAPLPEPASEISRHDTRATVEIATKASAVLVSATAPALALNQASSAAHDLAGVEGREGLVEPARAATAAAAAVIASTHFSCVRTPGEAVVHAGEETSSLSREGAVCDRGKEEGANDSIDKDNNNRCIAATAAARRRRKTSETKETPGGGAKNDGGGDGDGVEEAAGEGAASSAPSRGETDDVARGGSGRAFNGMKTARRRINATGKENADRLAAAVAGHAVGSGIASRSSSSSNNSVDDDKNVKGDREGTCSSILAPKPSVSEKELVDPSVSDAVGTVEDGDHAICTCSVAARAGKEKRVEVRHEDEEEGRQEPAEDGNLQTLGGVDFEDGGIEREQGTRAPVRKKKLQSDLTTGRTLTATVLANGSVAGEMRTNEEDGCRRKKVKDAGREGAEAEYSSVHNSEDKGSDEFVPISVGADAATNRPACTGTLDAEENEGNGRRARNEGGQLGKGAKARSLEIEYSSVQQPDDEGSVGAEAASDLFVDLSAIAQMTSPIRRRRSARSPTRDVGNATGGENNALAAQEEGIVKAFHASRKVPATPSSRQMLKGSPSPEQRLAQMLRLADDADLHEAMARAIKSVRSSTTSPVAPVDAARSERQCTMLEEEKDVDVFASVGGRVGAEGGYTSDRSWTNARQTDAQAYEISIAERMKVGVREGGRGARRGRGKGNMSHSVVSDGSVRLSPGEKKMSGEAGDVQSPGGKAMSRRKPLALEEVHVVQAQDCSGVIAATDG